MKNNVYFIFSTEMRDAEYVARKELKPYSSRNLPVLLIKSRVENQFRNSIYFPVIDRIADHIVKMGKT